MSQLITVSALITGMVGACYAGTKMIAWLWKGLRQLFRLADALTGEPAGGGQPARPGFLDRMASIEQLLEHLAEAFEANVTRMDAIDARLTVVEQHLAPPPEGSSAQVSAH